MDLGHRHQSRLRRWLNAGPTLLKSNRRTALFILVTIMAGHLFAGAFLHNLEAGLGMIRNPDLRRLGIWIMQVVLLLLNNTALRVGGLILLALLTLTFPRGMRLERLVDLMGGLLLLRCAAQFMIMNILLLSPMRGGEMLLIQLVLFLPVITIAFGWLYWRLDTGARRRGSRQIDMNGSDQTPSSFDYFHIAAITLVQFEPSGATARSRLMKSLFLVHGVVMLDLVALTLSRAVSLASSS